MNWTRKCVTRVITLRCGCRQFSQKLIAIKKKIIEKEDPTVIRNIGILAHIDAGKIFRQNKKTNLLQNFKNKIILLLVFFLLFFCCIF